MASSSTEQQQQASLNSLFPDTNTIDSICIGSGRFLRAVLVPALAAAGYHPAVVQTRSRGFLDHSLSEVASENGNSSWAFSYEVDTVNFDGSIETTNVPCWGAGTLGSPEGKKDVLELCASGLLLSDEKPLVLGLGVTEAGLSSSSTKVMGDLYDVLGSLATRKAPPKQISVINTDNVSQNGDVIRGFMEELATNDGSTRSAAMRQFLADSVVFHNTMVDRITSQRPGSDGLVPRAEPTPLKALVIEDLRLCLPQSFRETDGELFRRFGVVVRSSHKGQLDADIALKLRVANGTHTAIAHAMALSGLPKTDALVSGTAASKLLVGYLDSFFEHQIRAGVVATDDFDAAPGEAEAVYGDWRKRLTHAHFGLSTFFITQNGAAKGGIRIGPTVGDLLGHGLPVACSTAFALAAILRFLTPAHERGASSGSSGVYRGWLDGGGATPNEEQRAVAYADGLSYDLGEGWYEFRCDCGVELDGEPTPLPVALAAAVHSGGPRQPPSYEAVVGAYLRAPKGGNLSAVARSAPGSFSALAGAVAALYARMVAGDAAIDVLGGLDLEASCDCLVDGK
ncbi:unnamed protein product [Pseudo-nitzschia multistriata]|uniref:Mannitol dehydrogenase N-terminal domain-containing protein n=1 Tax=Pseudo-nitzschia multistriata TaxID=183589 RepID=A0A448ZE81_9STRA|nr:unnamed protein product [Pseudo-nitzschia multistriata]